VIRTSPDALHVCLENRVNSVVSKPNPEICVPERPLGSVPSAYSDCVKDRINGLRSDNAAPDPAVKRYDAEAFVEPGLYPDGDGLHLQFVQMRELKII